MEWHDLADGDRLYDATLLVAPAIWGTGRRRGGGPTGSRTGPRSSPRRNPTDRDRAHRPLPVRRRHRGRVRAPAPRATRRAAGTPRCSVPTSRPSAPRPCRTATRSARRRWTSCPPCSRCTSRPSQEHWGESEASEQRIEEWVEDPHFRLDLQVVVPRRATSRRRRSNNQLQTRPDGSVRGLLDGVATHPGHRRLGLARAAINQSLRLLRDAGATSAYLGVDTGNHNRAMELYESCGFRQASTGHELPAAVRPPGRGRMTTDIVHGARGGRRRRPRHPGPARSAARRHDDWAALADVVNRARRGRRRRRGPRRPSPAPPSTRRMRDVPARPRHARRGGRRRRSSPRRAGYLVVRDGALVAESFGRVVPGAPPAGHRRRPPPHAARAPRDGGRNGSPSRAARAPRPMPSTRSGPTMALIDAKGYVPIRFGFEMRRFLTGRPARAPAARGHRAPAGDRGPAPGDLGRGQRGVPRPLGPPGAGGGATSHARFHGPETDTVAVVRRLGRRRGRGLGA